MTEPSVETVDTEKDIRVRRSTITGDYSDYDVLDEEKENISLNDIVRVKFKKAIQQGIVIQIPYSIKEEDSEHLKVKQVDFRKEERVLIRNVSISYSKKESRSLLNSTTMEPTWRKHSIISPQKIDKE